MEIISRDGLSDEAVGRAHHILLLAVRPALDLIYIDAISDSPWPAEVSGELNALRVLGMEQRETDRDDPQMGIRLDPRSDEQFGLALALARYSIGVEGYSLDRQIFSANDTGTGLWADLSPDQYRALETLVGRGESVDALFEERVPKNRWRWAWFRKVQGSAADGAEVRTSSGTGPRSLGSTPTGFLGVGGRPRFTTTAGPASKNTAHDDEAPNG